MRALAFVALLLAGDAALAQNLFVNPDLDDGPTGWVLGCGTDLQWIADDEASCPGSGALHVTGGPCMGSEGAGAGQCVPAAGLAQLSVAGRVRATGGFAVIFLAYFESADCSGTEIDTEILPVAAPPGQWQTVSLPLALPPPATSSILVGIGAASGGPVDADIDAGYAGALPLVFRDGFEGDQAGFPPGCRWDAAVP